MPFVRDRPLESYFHPRAAERAAKQIADDAGDFMHAATRRRTPVRTGATRESIQRSPVQLRVGIAGRGYGVRIFSFHPNIENVEWPTRPHNIPGAFGYPEPFGIGGRFEGKFHPGTEGAHMFALAAADTEAALQLIARPALEVFKQEVVR